MTETSARLAVTAVPASKTAAGENFPVGSWLIAAKLRPIVAAFYRFARAADDIADHGELDAASKTARLKLLDAALRGDAAPAGDPAIDAALDLRRRLLDARITLDHPRHLLQAFLADAANRPCRGWSDLLAYCRYSAAPVGRFLLELHGEGRAAWPAADALCTALQILNHLQDCQADQRRLGRRYIPEAWLTAAGLGPEVLLAARTSPALRQVFDRVLDRVNRLNRTALTLPGQIANRGLRLEAAAIVEISRRLAAKLRRRDPLAARVALGRLQTLVAVARGIIRGWSR